MLLLSRLTKTLDDLMKVHPSLNLRDSRFRYDAKAEERARKDFMKLVFKMFNFHLLRHIGSLPIVLSAKELYNFRVDHDDNYDEMEQAGNVAGLDPCMHGFLFKN